MFCIFNAAVIKVKPLHQKSESVLKRLFDRKLDWISTSIRHLVNIKLWKFNLDKSNTIFCFIINLIPNMIWRWVRIQKWSVHFQQTNTTRQMRFNVNKNNNYRIGNSVIPNWLPWLINLILLQDLIDSLSSFKIKCKQSLLE